MDHMRTQARPISITTRRSMLLATLALLGAAWGAPPALAASSTTQRQVRVGVVTSAFTSSAARTRAFWTAKRVREAKPLTAQSLPSQSSDQADSSGAGTSGAGPTYVTPAQPHATSAGRLRAGAVAAASSSVKGIDTGESTVFPNSANGVVVGDYVLESEGEDKEELYQCSGSVIDSSAGDLLLTAGHCVIEPETGTIASYVAFVPGYREGAEPFGVWSATGYGTTSTWEDTVGTGEPDEAGNVAILRLQNRESDGQSIQSVVGGLGIGFNQPRGQTYTQYGYPAEEPYDGERLYSNTTAYAGEDTSFSPPTMRIASDFTGGASGGPWTVGEKSSPTALSVTDYYYEKEPGYMFGPYFGTAVKALYEVADGSGSSSEEESNAGGGSSSAETTSSGSSQSTSFRLKALDRNSRSGAVKVLVWVPGPGTVLVRGTGVRTSKRQVGGSSTVAVTVRATGRALRALDRSGHLAVRVTILYTAEDSTASKSRLIRLIRKH